MAQSSSVRLVPSGQVYRQLFDAQLQLNQSLSQFDSEYRIQRLRSRELTQSNSLPLIRLDKEETQHGILTTRQKTWVGGSPNDPYTENPALHKQYSEYLNQKLLQESKRSHAGWEVRALPDIIVPAKQGSDIVDRIAESRKQRHEAVLEDMHQALNVISTEVEPVVEEISTMLLAKFAADDTEIAALLAFIQADEDLGSYKMQDLNELWERIQAHTAKRHSWILEMDSELKKIETERIDKIREVFTNCSKKLKNISYLLTADLQRLLDKESQMINQTILSNQRSYADLYVRLISADIEREKSQHATWHNRVKAWKTLNTKIVIESFREFMQSVEVTQPQSIDDIMCKLLIDQRMLNIQRVELINTLCDMQPPNSTTLAVQKWCEDLQKISQELDAVTQMYMSKLHHEYEKVCQMFLEKIDNLKLAMIESGVCSSHKANEIVDEFMLPLVGRQQRVFEQNLEIMQKATDAHACKMAEEISVLFKYLEDTAKVWDSHEINLKETEIELQNFLENSKQNHDSEIQEKEANLDMVLDSMRQGANETALKESLVKALTMLNVIQESIEEFHEQQTQTVQKYPPMVQEQINSYDKAVCTFFSVARLAPASKASSRHSVESDVNESNDGESPVTEAADEEEKVQTPIDSANLSKTELHTIKSRSSIDKMSNFVIKEILYTSKGTRFAVIVEVEPETESKSIEEEEGKEAEDMAEEGEEAQPTRETELKEAEEAPEYIKTIDIPDSCFLTVKRAICMNFLEHLDGWFEEAMIRANSVVVAKCEELNSELDLRIHLHQPRPRRVELDVHNVRAAELVLHSERISQHCSGMEKRLSELKSNFKAMSLEHSKLAQKFKEDTAALQETFDKATKSSKLEMLQNRIRTNLDKFMEVIRASLRQFRQQLDEVLQSLRESNARFIKSFKTFSDGGNFCPEEVETFRKKLEKLSLTIDSTEGSIMSELDGMESKQLDNATKMVTESEDRLKSLKTDLNFMEFIARWLTNTQVKIKSEVASSNLQAQRLTQMMNDLERRILVLKNPKLKQEPKEELELNDTIIAVFDAFDQYSEYLHCKKSTKPVSSSTVTAAKPVINSEGKLSGGGSDPSIGIIKNILMNVEISKQTFLDETGAQKGLTAGSENEGNEQAKKKGGESGKSLPKGTEVAGDALLKKTQTGNRRISRQAKFDRKFTITEGADSKHFLSSVLRILKEANDSLVSSAEAFYQQKSGRPITLPQEIPQTYEQCTEIIYQKMQSYSNQAEEYLNQCLLEFQGQLVQLEDICSRIPNVIFTNFLKDEVKNLKASQDELVKEFQSTLGQLADRQKFNQDELRPNLGHPDNAAYLASLCELEKKRHEEYTETVAQYIQERQESSVQSANTFLEQLQVLSEVHLGMYDKMLTVDDVEQGKVEPKSYLTSELIRKSRGDRLVKEEEVKDLLPRGKASWIGIPSNQFVIGDKPSTLEVTATVQTGKTTLAHSATVKARDKTFEDYQNLFEKSLQEIKSLKQKLTTSEKCRMESWENSVEKLKRLYQT